MSQQMINNTESGLVTRTKINENYTELYARENTISSVNDLPAPSAGVYTLGPEDWNFVNVITLPPDHTIKPAGGSRLRAYSASQGGVIGNSNSLPTITYENGGFAASDIIGGFRVNQLGTAECITATGTSVILFLDKLFTSAAGGDIFKADNVSGFAIGAWTTLAGVNGIVLNGNIPTTRIDNFNPIGISGDMIQVNGTGTSFILVNVLQGSSSGRGIYFSPTANVGGMVLTSSVLNTTGDAFRNEGTISTTFTMDTVILNSSAGDAMDVSGGFIQGMFSDTCILISGAVAGAALRTDVNSATNIADGTFSNSSLIAPSGSSLVNATKKDKNLFFIDTAGVSDSVTVGQLITDGVDTNSTLVQNTVYPIPMTQTTTLNTLSERVTSTSVGVLCNDDDRITTFDVTAIASVVSASGAQGQFRELRLQKDGGVGSWVTFSNQTPVDVSNRTITMSSQELVELLPNECVRAALVNTEGTNQTILQAFKLQMVKTG